MEEKGKYEKLAERIGKLVENKNAAYGNSFNEAGNFLKLLYPDGIKPEQYADMLCVVRLFDKMKRIATRKDAFGESPYQDIVGYGLLGLEKDEAGEKVDTTVSDETTKNKNNEDSVDNKDDENNAASSSTAVCTQNFHVTPCPTCGRSQWGASCPDKCTEF